MNKKGLIISLSILNLVGYLGTIIVNALADILPINNETTGAISDMYPNLFVPAGLTFSIWGIIYLLLGIFTVYQLVVTIKRNSESSLFIQKIGFLFLLSSIANMGWIFAWHYQIVSLSLVIMLILLACLLAIYLRLNIGKSEATNNEKYMVHLPFSIYLGWITIATIANVTALLVDIHWNNFGLGEQFWAVLVIAVGIAIALAVLFTRRDIFYCLVVDWALLGILLKRLALPEVPAQSVIIVTIIGLVLVSAGIITQLIRKNVYHT
jgi:hypothetical protein